MILAILKTALPAIGTEWIIQMIKSEWLADLIQRIRWYVTNYLLGIFLIISIFIGTSYFYFGKMNLFYLYFKQLYFEHIQLFGRDISFVEYVRIMQTAWFALCVSPVLSVVFVFLRWKRRRERLQMLSFERNISEFDKRILTAEKINRYTDNILTCVCVTINNWFEIESVNDKAFRLNETLDLDMPTPMIGTNFFSTFYWMSGDVKKDIFKTFEQPEYNTKPVKISKFYNICIDNKRHNFEVVYQPIGNGHIERIKIFIFHNGITET